MQEHITEMTDIDHVEPIFQIDHVPGQIKFPFVFVFVEIYHVTYFLGVPPNYVLNGMYIKILI